MTQYTLKDCIKRAEGLGFYFVKCQTEKLYDVRDVNDNWICFHFELPDYFKKLDGGR